MKKITNKQTGAELAAGAAVLASIPIALAALKSVATDKKARPADRLRASLEIVRIVFDRLDYLEKMSAEWEVENGR